MTLPNKIILYDDVCPLCKAYTNGFVALGWLLPEHRIGFSEAPEALLNRIDLDRARHEIPLYDTESGETLYGKEALFFILGAAIPLLKPLFRWSPFRAFIVGLYQIITYNRRVIAGSKSPEKGFDCAPDFNMFYRWLYIGLAAFFSFLLLVRSIPSATDNLFLCFLAWLLFALSIGLQYKSNIKTTNYYGHLATVVFVVVVFLQILGWNAWVLGAVLPLATWQMIQRMG